MCATKSGRRNDRSVLIRLRNYAVSHDTAQEAGAAGKNFFDRVFANQVGSKRSRVASRAYPVGMGGMMQKDVRACRQEPCHQYE